VCLQESGGIREGAEGCADDVMSWYAVQVRSNFERVVSQTLTERRIENFYPFSERTDARKRVFRHPYFPGYVFFCSSLGSNAERHEIVSVPQVVRIVGFGPAEPEPIPDMQIAAVRLVARVAAELALRLTTIPAAAFIPGDKVRVLHGPLRGVEGYVSYAKNAVRLVILVDALGQAVSTEVDAGSLAVTERWKRNHESAGDRRGR
jgi:transcription antitermination factor NusG